MPKTIVISPEAAARFAARVFPLMNNPGCWEWPGTRSKAGYGRFMVKRKMYAAPRVAWTIAHGDPGDSFILHTCDNPPCVRLSHLELGSQRKNMNDAAKRGRITWATLAPGDVAEIKFWLKYYPVAVVARAYKLPYKRVAKMASGERWGSVAPAG